VIVRPLHSQRQAGGQTRTGRRGCLRRQCRVPCLSQSGRAAQHRGDLSGHGRLASESMPHWPPPDELTTAAARASAALAAAKAIAKATGRPTLPPSWGAAPEDSLLSRAAAGPGELAGVVLALVHVLEPLGRYSPAAQLAQPLPIETWPASHRRQLVAPEVDVYCRAGHCWQAVEAGPSAYDPGTQRMQAETPA
jgi:hypothetical protein